ncbi:MAG: sulfite exporter TauE/SafE family protein [Methylibium sp.]|uniref:sulfite exporter TauE/SafE family protein n=1 Tax=Methylibium sp. TaxID=2067992 RepID=UPI00183A8FC3|nr:sulfite exporter TauE/SafE family protein [Methylibium sp.]MBA2721680.1 sulfite exporter TauE/SafE family protein [Methylibium sp.]MBA3588828.1 sulfite exporter TauE/SafE family protein [Methylibium sp.]
MLALSGVAVIVGLLIGAVGVGGVLLIPALELLTSMSIQTAMATALFTFIFTGIVATVLFQRRGSIDWSITLPLCVGGALFGFAGAWANSLLDASVLTLILAVLIVFAGIYTLMSNAAARRAAFEGRPRARRNLLFVVGALTGFGSGLTGVGGPALSVPMMVMLGFSPLATVGASQVVQILAAVSGSAGNLFHGQIDFRLAGILTVFEIIGVCLGVYLAHAVNARFLRRGVGVLCVAVGAGLLIRSL